jgi:hypothetical protein
MVLPYDGRMVVRNADGGIIPRRQQAKRDEELVVYIMAGLGGLTVIGNFLRRLDPDVVRIFIVAALVIAACVLSGLVAASIIKKDLKKEELKRAAERVRNAVAPYKLDMRNPFENVYDPIREVGLMAARLPNNDDPPTGARAEVPEPAAPAAEPEPAAAPAEPEVPEPMVCK